MKNNQEVDVFFLGDTYYGEWHMQNRERRKRENLLKSRGYLDFSQHLDPLLNNADFVVANLECAITDREEPYFAREKVHVYAAEKDETIKALKNSNISLLTLANNHIGDYEKEGIVDTMAALKDAGLHYVGAGMNAEEAKKPFYYTNEKIPDFEMAIVSTYNRNPTNEKYGFYANATEAGVYQLNVDRLRDQIKEIKKEKPGCFTVLSPHWGANFIWRTHLNQNRAKNIIAFGFDMIMGHSAHMIQEVEYINKKLVVYSLGNFILNGDGEYKKRNLPPYSFIARLNVRLIDDKVVKTVYLYPFVCDNVATDYRPRLVNEKEFEHVYCILKSHKYNFDAFDLQTNKLRDDIGCCFEYKL
jgi:hypothetical protein